MTEARRIYTINEPMPPRVKRLWDIMQHGEAFTLDELSQRLGNLSTGGVRTRLTLLNKLIPLESFGEHGKRRYRISKNNV